MIALRDAIYTALNADGTYPGLVSATYFGMPVNEAAFDYVQYDFNDSPPADEDTSDDRFEQFPVLFKAFTLNPTDAKTITDRIVTVAKGMLGDAITGGTVTNVEKESEGLQEDPDKTPDGKVVWMSFVIVNFTVSRTGP